MEVVKVNSKELKREYDITVHAKDISAKVEQKLADIAKKAKFPGFREGKAPLTLVKKNYGKSIMGEVIEQVIEQTSTQAIKKEGERPAFRPKFEILSFEENSDLKYKMKFEVFPEVPDVKVEDIKLEKLKAEVDEAEVEEGLKRIAGSYKDFSKADAKHAAKKDDAVFIDFLGKIDGKEFDGGAAKDYQLEIGSKTFIDNFEEQLIGTKAGDEVQVKVTFPENYANRKFASKKAVFDVTVKEVRLPQEVKINDEFATKLGMENLEKLKDAIRKQVANDFESISKTLLKKELFDRLEKKCKFPLPEEMTNMEFEAIWEQVKRAIKKGEMKNKKEKDLEKEYRKMAERRVKLGIFLAEFGRRNDIKVANEELSQAIFQRASQFPGNEKKVFDYYTNTPGAIDELKGPLLEDKVVEYILGKIETKEKKITGKKLIEEGDKLQRDEEALAIGDDEHDHHHDHDHDENCDHDHEDHEHEGHVHGPGCNH